MSATSAIATLEMPTILTVSPKRSAFARASTAGRNAPARRGAVSSFDMCSTSD